ncbi:CDP-alcohol phosphatidyltransferase family protein [Aestuariivirga sp.]|uniref:CDP-alcohol phosphatidyltransferase family protein n=1 Tax=Aestuariivirga sp. TaxID=2650926 RepID=UPI0039E26DFC
MLLYFWILNRLHTFGWIIALMLAICCALRLARLNVALDDPNKPAWAAGFFTGAPAPAGAGLAMLPMYLGFQGFVYEGRGYALLVAVYVAAVAILMVSKVPTFSGKTLGRYIPRDMVLPILGLTALAIVLLISYPWETLTIFGILYLGMIPFGIRSYRRHKAADAKASAG